MRQDCEEDLRNYKYIGRELEIMEKIFKLKENRTSVKTEIVAGLTTFMTMAYIIALNPNLLTNFDVDTLFGDKKPILHTV